MKGAQKTGLLALALAALVATACAGGQPNPTATAAARTNPTPGAASNTSPAAGGPASSQEVKLVVTGPFSGDLAIYGVPSRKAVELAVEEWNARPGQTLKVTLEVGDDVGKGDIARQLATRYASDPKILGVIGPMNNASVETAAPFYEQAGLALVSPSATRTSLSERGWKTFHRVTLRDDAQGAAAAAFAADELNPQKVVVVDNKSAYSTSLADAFAQTLQARGVTAVQRLKIAPDQQSYAADVDNIAKQNPDLVFFAEEGVVAPVFLRELRAAGVTAQFLGSDGLFDTKQFIQGAQGAADGAYVVFLGPDLTVTPEAKPFVDKLSTRITGTPTAFEAQAYESANLMLEAMGRAAAAPNGKLERKAVLDSLNQIERPQSVLGYPLKFDAKGDLDGGYAFIYQVKNNNFTQVKAQKRP